MMIGLSPHGTRELLMAGLICGALGVLLYLFFPYALPVPVLLFVFLLSFFRDPERETIAGEGELVSPADGRISDIAKVEQPGCMEVPCLRIGIFLSVLNVHVNRIPVSGTVAEVTYTEGAFHHADSEAARKKNERNFVRISANSGPVGVMQLSGSLARKIVCTVKQGDRVRAGDRFGMIKLGSRTELYIPLDQDPEPRVSEGDHVYGASTIIATVSDSPEKTSHAGE